MLIGLFPLVLCAGAIEARTQQEEPACRQIKARVLKLGAGLKARVNVKLRDGKKVEGYIGQTGEDHFYVIRTDEEVGTAAVVAYGDVVQLRKRKGSLVTWRSVSIRGGLAAGAIAAFIRSLLQGSGQVGLTEPND